jgi:NAD(P)-dependent dehydrogenase (short-subunit alcohol dehydrogenase family)
MLNQMKKNVLITGGARRVGRNLALAVAKSGANVIIHHGHSPIEAQETKTAIERIGAQAFIVEFDLSDLKNISNFITRSEQFGPLNVIINNASIFEPFTWDTCDLSSWSRHMDINLTAPFLISQAFAKRLPEGESGRIINILDWRSLRPGASHFPYTISKAALASLTLSLAVALAPRIVVNGLALGAVLRPADGSDSKDIVKSIPSGRWATLGEVEETLLFLINGPEYITGEIIHIDGGRHLV